jgi:segregation and condensation protein A
MEYSVTIDKFSGPLDLLLHLIKKSNIEIYDIKLEDVTKQYLDYIYAMQEMNLNIASSYLVMASELIEIKSSMLLPKPVVDVDTYEEDPKERLIKRLIEYQNYKEISDKFHELELNRQQYYTKEAMDLSDFEVNSNLSSDITLNDLLDAFSKFLDRKEISKPLNTKITNKEYSIQQRSKEIKDYIKKNKKITFSQLFDVKTKSYVVVTFLSILALAKNKEIKISQDNNFDEIMLCEVS